MISAGIIWASIALFGFSGHKNVKRGLERVLAGLCLASGCNSREIWTDSISLSIYQFSGV